MATKLDLTHDQGTTFVSVLTIKSGPTTPINLTGYTFKGQAKAAYTDANPTFEFGFTLKDQTTDTGEVEMTIEAEATEDLVLKASTSYLYDIEMTSAGGIVTRLLSGKITLSPQVSK